MANQEGLTVSFSFFFNDTATTEIYTLSLHDALPIYNGTAHDVHGFRPPPAILELDVFVPVRIQEHPALLHLNPGRILQVVVSKTRLISGHGSLPSRSLHYVNDSGFQPEGQILLQAYRQIAFPLRLLQLTECAYLRPILGAGANLRRTPEMQLSVEGRPTVHRLE